MARIWDLRIRSKVGIRGSSDLANTGPKVSPCVHRNQTSDVSVFFPGEAKLGVRPILWRRGQIDQRSSMEGRERGKRRGKKGKEMPNAPRHRNLQYSCARSTRRSISSRFSRLQHVALCKELRDRLACTCMLVHVCHACMHAASVWRLDASSVERRGSKRLHDGALQWQRKELRLQAR